MAKRSQITAAVESSPDSLVYPPPRSIELDPEDWLWATWRSRQPLPRPEAQPFDLQETLTRLAKLIATTRQGQDWSNVNIPITMQREEAQFWVMAMVQSRHIVTEALLQQLQQQSFDQELDWSTVQEGLKSNYSRWQYQPVCPEMMLPLSNLFPVADLVNLIRDDHGDENDSLLEGFRRYVLPYLHETEVEQMRQRLHTQLDLTSNPDSFRLAATLGLHDDLQTLVKQWSKDYFKIKYIHYGQEAVFGLGDRQQVEHHTRRLNLKLRRPDYIRAWLAHTEYDALDWICDSILSIKNAKRKKQAEALLKVFALVNAPEATYPMLELMVSSLAPQIAHQWLSTHPTCAIPVLVPVADGKGQLADAAKTWLRILQQQGYAEYIQHWVERLTKPISRVQRHLQLPQSITPFDEETTPTWLRKLAPPRKTIDLPAWIKPEQLPPVCIGDYCLNVQQVQTLLVILKQNTSKDTSHPFVVELKTCANAASLETFAWEVFNLWLMNNPPVHSTWGARTVGLLGGDGIVAKLAALIRAWLKKGRRERQRSHHVLESLCMIGTDAALTQISTFVQDPFLRETSLQALETAAQSRHLTRYQLEDQLVPMFAFNEQGLRVFDFGSRQFHAVLDADLKPKIRAKNGALRTTLPKPGVKDDAELAYRAIADWTHLKQELAEVIKLQTSRLEQAMVTGHSWQWQDFETWIVKHPIMNHLARLLVWIGSDNGGQSTVVFRISEDGTYANDMDETISGEGLSQVGIVHPLHLSESQRFTWGELLSNYKIMPPFPQVGRSIYTLEPAERTSCELQRFRDQPVFILALNANLEKLGWCRLYNTNGWYGYCKAFYAANLTAIAKCSNRWQHNTRSIESCSFVSGIYSPYQPPDLEQAMSLSEVDAIVMSEVLRDLSTIAAKSK